MASVDIIMWSKQVSKTPLASDVSYIEHEVTFNYEAYITNQQLQPAWYKVKNENIN